MMKKQTINLWMIALAIAGCFFSTSTFAQEEESSESAFSFGADVYNRYIWRGINLGGNAPAVQPGIEVALGKTGLAVGAWGSYTLSDNLVQEADLYLSYSPIDMISVAVTDYFFPTDGINNDYFNYKDDETGHTIEAMVSFNGTESIPVSLMFAINVYGFDALKPDGEKAHSSYLELGYSKEIKGAELSLFAGATLTDADNTDTPDIEETGFYGQTGPALINLGLGLSKEIKITESFSLPVSSSLIFNPDAGNIFIVFGFTL